MKKAIRVELDAKRNMVTGEEPASWKIMDEAINEAEGKRVSARTITASDVRSLLRQAQDELDKIMPKKMQVGLKIIMDRNAQDFPRSYRGIPESTLVQVERRASGWFVTEIYRYRTMKRRYEYLNLMTPERTPYVLASVEREISR